VEYSSGKQDYKEIRKKRKTAVEGYIQKKNHPLKSVQDGLNTLGLKTIMTEVSKEGREREEKSRGTISEKGRTVLN